MSHLICVLPGTVLDVGANIGTWAFYWVAQGHRVVAVEGMPSNVAMINATLCANPSFAERMIVKHALLGAPENEADDCAIVTNVNSGNGNVICGKRAIDAYTETHPGSSVAFVPVRTLQSILDEVGIFDYQAFKMDIEGSECKALRGAPDLANRYTLNFVLIEQTFDEVKECAGKFAVDGDFRVLHNSADLVLSRGTF